MLLDKNRNAVSSEEEPSIWPNMLLHAILLASQLFCAAGGSWLLSKRAKDQNYNFMTFLEAHGENVAMVLLAVYNSVPSGLLVLLPIWKACGVDALLSGIGMIISTVCVVGMGLAMFWAEFGVATGGEWQTIIDEFKNSGN